MADRQPPLKAFGSETTDSVGSIDTNNTSIRGTLNDSSLGYANGIATDTGSANNYIVTAAFGTPSALNAGFDVRFIAANSNTGASTLTFNPLASAPIVDWKGNPIVSGAIQGGGLACVTYVAGAFRLHYTVNSGVVYSNPVVTVTGTTTIPCGGSSDVTIMFDSVGGPSGTYVLALTGIGIGTHINIHWIMAGGGQKLQFSGCTDASGNTISNIRSGDWTGGVATDNDLTVAQSWGGTVAYFMGFCTRDSRNSTTYLKFMDFFH